MSTYNPLPRWRDIVKKDNSKLVDALAFYNGELESAHKDLMIEGNLSKIVKFHAYYLGRYLTNAKDLEGLQDYFTNQLAILRGKITREWLDNPPTNRVPSPSETKTAVEGDERMIECRSNLEEVKYISELYDAIMKSWEQRGFSLGQLTRLVETNNMEAEV